MRISGHSIHSFTLYFKPMNERKKILVRNFKRSANIRLVCRIFLLQNWLCNIAWQVVNISYSFFYFVITFGFIKHNNDDMLIMNGSCKK